MFIIRLIFYLAVGTMDSSFLTGLHISLALFSCLFLVRLIIQFGLPNHPARFLSYLVSFCIVAYFISEALTDLGLLSPWVWVKWRAFPLVAGGFCLLLQTITLLGTMNFLQQRVISRLPLIVALLSTAFFSQFADALFSVFLLLGGLFLIVFVRKSRYQKRLYVKMSFMFIGQLVCNYLGYYYAYLVGQVFLCLTVFYAFLFQQSFGILALIDDHRQESEGDLK
jgi:hypothetical protein